ncbi:MAG: 23S rRNA (uracil(1939)-C(5))-methyltransferase RlmD [Eubacterium sp.]|nr:23S rRNA (uracil(1939)-C(5))-methyltransferase RlmD [Eubacterium sp.]
MKKNELFEMTIDDITKDGQGIGHADGLAVFVKDTAPQERIRCRIIKEKKNLAYGRLEEILEPSPFRVERFCPKARSCGGCTLQHISYKKQLELKQRHVENCLSRIGGVSDVAERMEPIIGMETPLHFRNKMQFPVGTDKEGQPSLGFYAGHTHSLIALDDCPTGHPVNRLLMMAFREYLTEEKISIYDETTHTGLVRHFLTRVGFGTGEVMVCVVINGEELPHSERLIELLSGAVKQYQTDDVENRGCIAEYQTDVAENKAYSAEYQTDVVENRAYTAETDTPENQTFLRLASVSCSINRERTNRILGDHSITIYGETFITDTIGNLHFEIAPESFFQVNPVQTVRLYGKALEYAGLTGVETVWDMYCGIGSISLFLAQKAKKVYGVEIVPQAIENAKRNASLNGIDNVVFFTGKAEEIVPGLYKQDPEQYRADVVVVDPPRKGCDQRLLDTILSMAPKKLVYVSCDPSTLARDVAFLTDGGYYLEKAVPVDMFPHSMHVETVVLMNNKNAKPKDYVEIGIDAEEYYNIKDSEKVE